MSVSMQDVKKLREMTGAGILDSRNALQEADGNIDRAVEILREKGMASTLKKSGRITAEGLVQTKVEDKKGVILEVNSETDFVAKNKDFKDFVEKILDFVFVNEPNTIDELKSMKLDDGKTVEDDLKGQIAKIGENIVLRRFDIFNDEDVYIGQYNHGGRIASIVELKADDVNVYNDEEFIQFGKDLAMQVTASSPKYVNKEDVPEEIVEHEREILINQAMNEADKNMDPEKAKMIAQNKVKGRLNKQLFNQIVLLNQEFIKDPSLTIEKLLKEKQKKFAGLKILKFTRFEVGEGLEKKEEDFAEEVKKQMGQ